MPDDFGLPPPPPPVHPPPSIPQDPGVAKGIVKDSLGWTKEATKSDAAPWSKSDGTPKFGGAGVDPLKPISPGFEKVFTGNPLEAADAMLHAVNNPVTWATDTYQTYKNDAAQKAFVDQYGPTLDHMASNLKGVMLRLNNLAQQLRDRLPKLDSSKAEGIYNQKKRVGDEALADIDRAYENASPEDRQKLDAMRSDLTNWMKNNRDARVQSEEGDMKDLAASVGSAQHEVLVQSSRLDKLAGEVMSASMGKQLSPQEWAFAAALRNFLGAAKGSMDAAIQAGAK